MACLKWCQWLRSVSRSPSLKFLEMQRQKGNNTFLQIYCSLLCLAWLLFKKGGKLKSRAHKSFHNSICFTETNHNLTFTTLRFLLGSHLSWQVVVKAPKYAYEKQLELLCPAAVLTLTIGAANIIISFRPVSSLEVWIPPRGHRIHQKDPETMNESSYFLRS